MGVFDISRKTQRIAYVMLAVVSSIFFFNVNSSLTSSLSLDYIIIIYAATLHGDASYSAAKCITYADDHYTSYHVYNRSTGNSNLSLLVKSR